MVAVVVVVGVAVGVAVGVGVVVGVVGVAMTDWRYFVTYEGVVSTGTDDEQEAINAALEDVANGKIPNVEVEEIEG